MPIFRSGIPSLSTDGVDPAPGRILRGRCDLGRGTHLPPDHAQLNLIRLNTSRPSGGSQSVTRIYMDKDIDFLEDLVANDKKHAQVLGDVRDELTYRTSDRAKRLRRDVEGLLAGELPAPGTPPRPARPEDQTDLLDG